MEGTAEVVELQQPVELMALKDVKNLKRDQWTTAFTNAKEEIRNMLVRPVEEMFKINRREEYPRWLIVLIMVVLSLIGTFALLISAGKQLASFDMVYSEVTQYTNRVGTGWVDIALLASLLLGELGALAFSFAAAMFQRAAPTTRWMFRIFQAACMFLALGGNVLMTLQHPLEGWGLAFQWMLSLLLPSLVIGIGMFLEEMYKQSRERQQKADEDYENALDEYKEFQEHPEKHPSFPDVIVVHLLQALKMAQTTKYRQMFEDAINESEEFRDKVIEFQLAKHMGAAGDVFRRFQLDPLSPESAVG